MKYLLDTHAIIWYLEDSDKLPLATRDAIDNINNDIYISTVSLWEIAVKVNIGKLKLNVNFDTFLADVKDCGFDVLHIENNYLKKLTELPLFHRDPFDRTIISTALAENLTIITIDDNIYKYNVSWVWENPYTNY